jgi:hypothetical protein
MLSEAQRFAESASEIQRTWIYFRDCSWFWREKNGAPSEHAE